MKKPSVPRMSLPVPNAMAKPTDQKTTVEMARLTMILPTTAPTFLPREKPTSSMANPSCMNSTSTAATMTQTVSTASWTSSTGIAPS